MGRGTDADRAERHGIANWMGYELDGPTRSAVAAGTEADEAFVVGMDTGILVAYVPAHFCRENGGIWKVGGREGGRGGGENEEEGVEGHVSKSTITTIILGSTADPSREPATQSRLWAGLSLRPRSTARTGGSIDLSGQFLAEWNGTAVFITIISSARVIRRGAAVE